MMIRLSFFIFIFLPQDSWGWGKRGHALISEAAAYTLAKDFPFLKSHSFDMAYYGNVPDIIWKRPASNAEERDEHYVNLEVFKTEMGEATVWNPNRKAFFKKYPKAKSGGAVFWRVSELCERLASFQRQFETARMTPKGFRDLQMKWLSVAGVIGHYIGDLSQPLHTTANHDGQLTRQSGVHSFYETEVVNELYPQISQEVFDVAKSEYGKLIEKKDLSCFDLARDLAQVSFDEVASVLEPDTKDLRGNIEKAALVYRRRVIQHLGRGAAYLSVIWSKYARWPYSGKEFWNFDESPKYIVPGQLERN